MPCETTLTRELADRYRARGWWPDALLTGRARQGGGTRNRTRRIASVGRAPGVR